MKEIPLTKGLVAIVDDADYDDLAQFKWYASYYGYAIRSIDHRTKEFMSRRLLGLTHGDPRIAEHGNGNKLDNRRSCNLRIATSAQNMFNTKIRKDNTSGAKGVTWDAANKKWRAQLSANGKKVNIGRFSSFDDAKEAYANASAVHHGEFACLDRKTGGKVRAG